MKTTTLYRPVGPKELALIEASGWKAFPPRLPDQPIFYPVMNEDYAERTFQDEFRRMLELYQINYNEAYVWD